MKNLALQALAAGPQISGTTGAVIIVAIIVGALMFMWRRGTERYVIVLVVLAIIIALALLGGWHPHAIHIPKH